MMKRVSPQRSVGPLPWAPLCLVGAGLLLTLTGCPGGADLEHPEKYGDVFSTTGGTGATGGTGGTGNYPLPVLDCDYQAIVGPKSGSCGPKGCHGPASGVFVPGAGLNMALDDGFVSRLKDVPSTHADIYCGSMPCATLPETCPTGDFLVDSGDYTKSWLLLKVTNSNGCGDPMPAGSSLTADELICFEKLVKAIAELP